MEPRRRAREFVLGLPSDLPHKNCWTLAEYAGDSTPYGLQRLLLRAKWDADAIRDDLRGFVVEQLLDDKVVLVVDETGNAKKGIATVGMQRQYTGTAGRIENSQVAVYLACSTRAGMRRSTGNCMCRAPGLWTRSAAGPLGYAKKSPSSRSRLSPFA